MRALLRSGAMDVLLAVALTGLAVTTLLAQTREVAPPAVALAVLSVAPLALRQVAPVLVTLVISAALATHALLGYGEFPSAAVGLVIGVFTVAMLRPRRVTAAVFATGLAVLVTSYANTRDVVPSQIGQAVVILLVAWGLGESTRRWATRAELAALEASRAVADERLRIARELHDVVSHHMSVVSLQAGLAGYVLDTDVPTARTAVATAAEAAREALVEMRRMLGALRVEGDDDAAQYRPQPGLAQLPALLERFGSVGLDVRLSTAGPVRELPPGLDLCAYRVVQESLTNTLRHAGPARARVAVEYGERLLTVTVVDDGPVAPAGAPAVGGGHGVRGMRERAELYGGVLEAGPAPGGGFRVRLRLPLVEVAAEPMGDDVPVREAS